MKKFFLTMFLCLSFLGYSQGENDNWYFGQNAAVNFASVVLPVALNNSQMSSAVEACGTVSDVNGKLLFYTDGSTIWNRDHQIMTGSGLTGTWSSEQLAIVKHPGNQNRYYIFTTGTINLTSTSKIAYSVVDMSQGSSGIDGLPLGEVDNNLRNVPVVDNNGNFFKTEAIAVVPTSSGDFWVVIPNGLHLYSYLFSDILGFNNGNPIVSDLDFPASLSETDLNHFGIKVSPKLNSSYNFSHYLCISSSANPDFKNVVYSFNNSTGKITTNYRLNIYSINSYIPEFNRDSSILFLGYDKLFAVNLLTSTSTNPVFSQVYNFGVNTILGAIQRNKHNDIYFSLSNRNYLGKINNPEIYGTGISVNLNFLNLGTNSTGQNLTKYGLPQLIEHRTFESKCNSDIVLTTPEAHASYVYRAFNTIKTENNYQVNSSSQNIVLKAGKSITLYPNTNIQLGSTFFTKIEECINQKLQKTTSNDQKPIYIWLDVAKEKEFNPNDISIYPIPTSDILYIKSDSKISNVYVVDMTGRKINVRLDGEKVDVKNFPSGTYLINIETKKGVSTQKFIKK